MFAGSVCLVATVPGQASADPPGNNGTVKVDGVAFDDHPDNEPHVGCVFQVDWYGFDEGEDLFSHVTFEVHPPTGKPAILLEDDVFIGEDDNSGGGSEAGLDASETYDLTTVLQGFEPHPQQGWHVKLTVNNDGSQGADVKHKVFWVSGCETPPTTTTSTTSTSTTSTSTTSTSTTSTTEKPTTTSTTEKPTTTSTTEKPTTTSTTEKPTTSTTQASTTSTTEASTTTVLGSSTSTTSIVSSPVGELPRTGNGTGLLLTPGRDRPAARGSGTPGQRPAVPEEAAGLTPQQSTIIASAGEAQRAVERHHDRPSA
jgi:hypothetical protein